MTTVGSAARFFGCRGLLGRSLLVLTVLVGSLLATLWRGDLPRQILEERYASPSSRFVTIEGQRVHYRDEGVGPTLLLLHGTAASLHTWDGWVEHLSGQMRLIRLDLPGFGLTGPSPTGDYRAASRLRIIEGLLDHLQVEYCAVAGNSLGGFLAWRLALQNPQRVEGLILIDAAGYIFESEGSNVLDLARTPILQDLLVRLTPRFLVARGLRQVYGAPEKLSPGLIDRYHQLLLAKGNRSALVQGMTQRSRDESSRISDIQQPTLIMWGRQDTWIPLSVGERFRADLSHSQLKVYDGVGHVPMEEVPVVTASDAATFLGTEVRSFALPSESLGSESLGSENP